MAGKQLTDDEREAIWAMLCAKMSNESILRELAAGTAGLEPHRINRSTLVRQKKRLIAERGQPRLRVKDGEEMSAIDALRRESIEMAGRRLEALKERERAGSFSASDLRMLRAVLATLDDAKRRAKLARTGATKQERGREGGSGRGAAAGETVRRMAQERAKMRAEQKE